MQRQIDGWTRPVPRQVWREPKFTLIELLVVIVLLVVLVVSAGPPLVRMSVVREHVACRANLKATGQAIALYTDVGTKDLAYLEGDLFGPLLEGGYLVSFYTKCSFSRRRYLRWRPRPELGEYEIAPDLAQNVKNRTWLVRDTWARGANDPSGNNNGHGRGKFNFLAADMNFVGDQDDWQEDWR